VRWVKTSLPRRRYLTGLGSAKTIKVIDAIEAIEMAADRVRPLPKHPLRAHLSGGAQTDALIEMPLELNSAQLLGRANAVFICHEGERYTLRRTSKGKLILTK
jgi:hemin uptake protein HemP